MTTRITTQDGTTIINDPEAGCFSAPTREAAEAELRRRRAARKESEAA